MLRRALLIALACVMSAALAPAARAQLAAERVVSGFDFLVLVTSIPGDSERLFLLEKAGTIEIVKNGAHLARPFLDITSLVNVNHNEQGLLGLAFDPDYAVNGHFYVYYTAGTGTGESVIQRYTVSSDPDSADPTTATSIFEIDQPSTQHNGGTVLFGSDGYLYLGLGESNSQNRAQDPLDLLGKMLRLDVDGDDFPGDPVQNYAIPPDNPFVGNAAVRDEIWALGLRNPYRFSFDRLTGDLFLADVGQDSWEELDFEMAGSPGGANYGWPLMEGPVCFSPPTDCDDGSLTHPIHAYPHVEPMCWSITGGVVYRGSMLPSMWGHYFFGDFCNGYVWSLLYDQSTVTDLVDWTTSLVPINGGFIWNVSSIGEDGLGELCVTSSGALFRIIPDPAYVGVEAGPVASGELRCSPNPFSTSTRIALAPDRPGPAAVSIYTAAGRLVRRVGGLSARASLVWDGRDDRGRRVPGGIYFVRATTGDRDRTTRVTFVP